MSGETPEIPEKWLKRVKKQEERWSNMSDEEREIWGVKPGETLKDKRQRDEEENPSRR